MLKVIFTLFLLQQVIKIDMSKSNSVSNQPSAPTNGTVKVIVIGSGMSGICAARQLADQTNFDITILEANPDRWGGRIWSYEVPGYPGTITIVT